MEFLCMIFFTLEYFARFIVSPQKCTFIRQPLNVIDFLTIMPFFIEECMHIVGIENVELRNLRGKRKNRLQKKQFSSILKLKFYL